MATDARRRIRKRAFAQAVDFRRKERTEGSKLRTILYYEVNNTDSNLVSLRREKSIYENKLQTLKKIVAQRSTSQAIEKTIPSKERASSKDKSSPVDVRHNEVMNNRYVLSDHESSSAKVSLSALTTPKEMVVPELLQASPRHVTFKEDTTIFRENLNLTQKIEMKSSESVYIASAPILNQPSPRNRTLTDVLDLLPEEDREKALECQRGSSPDPFNFNHYVCLGLSRLNLEQALNRSKTFISEIDNPTATSSKILVDYKDVVYNVVEKSRKAPCPSGTFDTTGLEDLEWNDLVGQKTNQKALLNITESTEDGEKALVEKNFEAMLREAKRARYVRQSEFYTNSSNNVADF